MRFARLNQNGRDVLALKTDRGYFDISAVRSHDDNDIVGFLNAPNANLGSLEADIAGQSESAAIDMSTASHLVPVARPGKVICLGLNYQAHAAEGGFNAPEYPVVFFRSATSFTPHGSDIKLPANSYKLDYEAEMAVIIGKAAYCVSEADALDHVAGYSVFNDATIRDYQKRTHQWTVGKNFDKTGGFGPDLVTPDELPKGASGLRISTTLDGEVLQDANTSDMVFNVAKIIHLMSECMTLEPGDVIVSGTPEGVGYVRKPPIFMKEGQTCVIEIEKVGTLSHKISHM